MNLVATLIGRAMLRTAAILIFLACGFVAECLISKISSTQHNPKTKDRVSNVGFTVLYHLFDGTIGALLPLWLLFAMYSAFGSYPHPLFKGSGIAFTALCVIFALIVGDFIYYWFHRWQHSSRWMWPIHELHHSDECMNVTTAWRIHWMESPFRNVIALAPTLILPNPMETIPATYICVRLYSYFTHMNARVNLGPFTKLIGGPQFHRLHHSLLPEHIDKNFMGMFPVWDIIFGTYVEPDRDSAPPTGIADGQRSMLSAMTRPFSAWVKLVTN